MSLPKFVDYKNFDINRVFSNPPEQKQVPGMNVFFYNIPIVYNYGTEESPVFDDLYIQGPKSETGRGIEVKDMNGKDVYSIGARYPTSNPDYVDFVNKMLLLSAKVKEIILSNVSTIKFGKLNEQSFDYFYNEPIYIARDKVTNEIIHGRAPSCYYKLIKSKYISTNFSDLNKVPIDWKLLTNSEIEYYPLIHVSHIYTNSSDKIRLQLKLPSAVVLSVKQAGSSTRQEETIERLVAQDPSLKDKLAEQIAKLSLERQDTLVKDEPKVDPSKNSIDDIKSLVSGQNHPSHGQQTQRIPMQAIEPQQVPHVAQDYATPHSYGMPSFTQPNLPRGFGSVPQSPHPLSTPKINGIGQPVMANFS